ncbi:MAG TPA: alpha/beta hydrolase [Micromonosporaceae bacterium]|nr:alpha/beta hydrolase [Micromonosporaceae bacterium]
MIRRTAVALLAVVALALALGGCVTPRTRWMTPTSGSASGASSAPSASTELARWSPCPDLARSVLRTAPPNVTFDCATIKVPRDWAAPQDGQTYDIALVRARATGQRDRVGSLVVNPGGPGGSGVETAVGLATQLPAELTRRFDLVGFDPRGVGRSSPVECFSDADLEANFGADPDPVSQADFDAIATLARRMAQGCGDKYGDSLRLFSTEQTARDMDAVRAAVGDDKLSYLGYSYGSLLGAVYAQLFPGKVRALVLDGAVDPTQPSTVAAEGQAKGFERAFDNFAAWCRGNTGQCPLGPDARAVVKSALDTARTNPVRGAGGRRATGGWIFTAVVFSLYTESRWPALAKALDNLRRNNATNIFALADAYAERDAKGHYSNLFDANLTVNCTDDDKTPTVEQIRQLQGDLRQKYPLFGANLALNLICAQWPGKRDPYPTGAATGAPPIVVVGTKGDPATPYEQTAKLAQMLGVGTVLTWEGEGHTAYPQTRCINDAVNRYLIDLTVPAANLTCPAR